MMEQSNLNIGTIGQQLEAARQSKGVSVSEAGQATKILSKFIEAMESDDFGALSAPVYAKSFIRMYAQYLGLDACPLVDEYVAQHAPKTKTQLTDEVRSSLSKADAGAAELTDMPAPSKPMGNKNVFGDLNECFSEMEVAKPPLKLILSAVGAIVLLGIIVLTVSQCAGDEEEVPAVSGGAASVERQLITEDVPDVYLVKPGVVEVDK